MAAPAPTTAPRTNTSTRPPQSSRAMPASFRTGESPDEDVHSLPETYGDADELPHPGETGQASHQAPHAVGDLSHAVDDGRNAGHAVPGLMGGQLRLPGQAAQVLHGRRQLLLHTGQELLRAVQGLAQGHDGSDQGYPECQPTEDERDLPPKIHGGRLSGNWRKSQ